MATRAERKAASDAKVVARGRLCDLHTCMTWTGRVRCEAPAVGYLYHPDGTPNPGGYVCQAHGDAILTEYREKLGEVWTLRQRDPVAERRPWEAPLDTD